MSFFLDVFDKHKEIILWIISIIIVPSLLVYWQTHKGEKIAEAAGAFKKPSLQLNVFFNYFMEKSVFNVCIGHTIPDKVIYSILDIPLYINNIGENTLEEVILSIKFPSKSNLLANIVRKTLSGKDKKIKFRSFFENEECKSVSYKVGNIHPQTCIHISEKLLLQRNKILNPESFHITIAAKNIKPLEIEVNMFFVPSLKEDVVIEYMYNLTSIPTCYTIPKSITKFDSQHRLYQECTFDSTSNRYSIKKLPKGWKYVSLSDSKS